MNYLILAVLCVLGSVAKASPQNFIVNGDESNQIVPYHVHLLIGRTGAPISNFGSGALITQNRVLTVAQNLAGFSTWRAGVGSLTRANLIWYNSVIAFIHPNYDARFLINNIGVIQIQPVLLSVNVQPIPLPDVSMNMPFLGFQVIASGFGLTNNGNAANTLNLARKSIISQEDCAAVYPHITQAQGNISDFFCAVDTVNGSNICGGDQGSPITLALMPQSLFGISSFNSNGSHCIDSRPSAYIRVTSYLDWISTLPNA